MVTITGERRTMRNHRKPEDTRARRDGNKKQFEVTGTLRCHKRGFGFLGNLQGAGEDAEDLFVGARKLEGLLDGDVCRATVVRGEEELEIVDITTIRRVRTRVFGTSTGGKTIEVDPGVGVGEIALDRDTVRGHTIVAVADGRDWKFERDLGACETEEALYQRIMERYMLPSSTSSKARAEAQKTAARTTRGGGKRKDLRGQLVITIDADHSKDLDDALAARIEKDGAVRVWVHIADVAEHVRPGSAIDAEAAKCPTSVYLPMRTRPMLPEELSEKSLSLLPGEDRGVLTAEMLVSGDGEVLECLVYESTIRSRARLSYVTVARHIRGERSVREETGEEISDLVSWLWHAASRLGVQRKRRGGVEGGLLGERNGEEEAEKDAHMLVERLMVAANEAVAKWLEDRGMPALYRCHEAPGEESLLEIEATAGAFGYNVSFPRPCTPIAFAAFCDQISQSKNAGAMWDVVGAALERASYTTANRGHFGLGSERYLHFTSPLRRYADLLVHRVVKSVLHGSTEAEGWRSTLAGLEQHITEISERAGWAERDAKLAVSLIAMQNQPRRRGVGVVRGISASQVRVHIAELGQVGGSIGVRRMRGGYTYDPVRRELISSSGKLVIGDELSVKAERIDPMAGVLELKMVDKGAPRGVRAEQGKPQGGSGGRTRGDLKGRGGQRNESKAGRPRGRRGGRGRGQQRTAGQS